MEAMKIPAAKRLEERRPSPRRSYSTASSANNSGANKGGRWQDDVNVATFNNGRPRNWLLDLSALPKHFVKQTLGINPFRTSYFSLYRPIKGFKSRTILACAVFFSIAAGVPLPLIGYVFGQIVNEFPPPEGELLMRLEQLIGIAIGYFFITWMWSVCWGVVGENVSRGLRKDLLKKAIGMDMAYFDVESPDITAILTGDTQTIQTGTSEKVGLLIQSISYFVAAFTVGFILNAELTGILFAAVIPLMFLVVMFGTTTVSMLSKKATAVVEEAGKLVEGSIDAIQVVQAFGTFHVLSEKHFRLLSRAARIGFRKGIAGASMLGAVYFLAYSANALAFWKGNQMLAGNGAGTIYAVVFLILDASFVVGQFGPFVQSLTLAASAGGKVLAIIDRPSTTIDVYSKEGKIVHAQDFGLGIFFDNVTFAYPSRPASRILEDVTLNFRPGESTAIVGLSGSGKSTIASLILRLYDVTSGTVRIGDMDIKDINVRDLRSHIALVDQDPVLFTGSILENISHGILNIEQLSEEQVMRKCIDAAAAANADFVSDLSNGIHTRIGGTGGVQLSGGQKQRICLARALARDPSILVLDEPTSSLDSRSENLILEALRKISQAGCTVITIAHRLATIRDVDKIMVMEQGSLVEEGAHDDLSNSGGVYSRLLEAQKLEHQVELQDKEDSGRLQEQHTYADQLRDIKTDLENGSNDSANSSSNSPATSRMSSISLIKRCLAISRPERYVLTLGILGSIFSGGLIVGEAIIFGRLISTINSSEALKIRDQQVDFLSLMFFVVALIAFCAYTTSGSAFGLVSESIVKRTRDMSFRTILRQDPVWFSYPGHSTQEIITMISTDSAHLSGLSGIILGTMFSVATSIIGGIVLAHIVAWRIAIVLLSAVPIMIAAGFARLRVLAKFEQRQETAYSDAAAFASEACRAIRTVAAFGREDDIFRQYCASLNQPHRNNFRFLVLGNAMLAFSLAVTYFVYSLAYWWGAKQVRDGYYGEEQFFTVLPALLFSAQAAGQMFSLAPEFTRAKAAARSVFSLHDEKPSILPAAQEDVTTDQLTELSEKTKLDHSLSHEKTQLSLHGIGFAYPSRSDVKVLEDVSFEIESGEFVGVVGASGAGKSSLISLLERFYDPDSGHIALNGVDIKTVPVEEYRGHFSLVPQEPALFTGSLSFNVAMGARPGTKITQDDIETVCEQLNLHGFIMSLPSGYQTDCGQNGSQLSGGQKQRVAIARALIREPEILLLDEATASLDAHSEELVQDAVAIAKQKGTTTIVVAHRLRTVQKADRILVFDKGKLAEQGTHEELITKNGIYAAMVLAQNV